MCTRSKARPTHSGHEDDAGERPNGPVTPECEWGCTVCGVLRAFGRLPSMITIIHIRNCSDVNDRVVSHASESPTPFRMQQRSDARLLPSAMGDRRHLSWPTARPVKKKTSMSPFPTEFLQLQAAPQRCANPRLAATRGYAAKAAKVRRPVSGYITYMRSESRAVEQRDLLVGARLPPPHMQALCRRLGSAWRTSPCHATQHGNDRATQQQHARPQAPDATSACP